MISIIIPAYNEEKNIGACLQSISDLDYPKESYEIILVDNGSSDRTIEIAELFNVKIIINTTKNVSGLRNLGAEYAAGDVLAFVDADCIVSPQWLKNASVHINDESLAAWGAPPVIPENSTWVQETWFLIRKKEKKVQPVDWLESMNLFVRKIQFINIGGFNESLTTCEDVDFCFRIKKFGNILSDADICVIHIGEARTIKEFLKKEIWRGESNFKGLFSHGLKMNEIPSLVIPIYFGLCVPLLLLLGWFFKKSVIILGFTILLYLLPSAAVFYKIRNKEMNSRLIFKLFLLLQIYFFARTIAVFKRADKN